MPLPTVSGGIAVFLEHFSDGRFALQEMHLVQAFGDDGINTCAIVVAARKEGGSRRGTTRRSRMEIGEAHAPSRQLVENGRLNRPPVTAEVTKPKIVDKEGDDIRMFVLGKTRDDQQKRAQNCKGIFHGKLIDFRWIQTVIHLPKAQR